MPLDNSTLKAWANGVKSGAMTPDEDPGNPEDMEMMGEEEDLSSEKNAIWAGEGPDTESGEELMEEQAEELIEWLTENEPEIAEAVTTVAIAAAEEDVALMEEGKAKLEAATQYLNPEYPPMDEGQKAKASEKIAKHMAEKGHPAAGTPPHKQAVAIGLNEARRGPSPGMPESEAA